MISNRGYKRLARSLKESGFFSVDQEGYEIVLDNALLAFDEIVKALEFEDALTFDGYNRLTEIAGLLDKFIKDYDSLKVIPLR